MKLLIKGRSRKFILSTLALIVVLVITAVSSFVTSAANETILEDINPDLTYLQVKGEYETWDTTKTSKYYHESGSSKYKIVTNAYNVWWTTDDFDFAYKKYNFNFGSKSELTVETTITSLGPQKDYDAACGIMIRSSLANNASMVNLQIRPSRYLVAYRTADGTGAQRGPSGDITPKFPIKLKMVLKNGKVSCYYAMNNGNYIPLTPAMNFIHSGTVYVGLEAYASKKDLIDTVEYDGFSVKIDAPAGTKYDEPGGSVEEPEEEKVIIQDDNIFNTDEYSNLLMAETFSDGDILTNTANTKAVYNPIWKIPEETNTEETILLNEDKTNRFLRKDYDSAYYVVDKTYVADSKMDSDPREWADYTFESDVYIKSAVLEADAKNLTFMMRFNDTAQYGYYYYAVQLHDQNKLSIGRVLGKANIGTKPTWLSPDEQESATWDFEYLSKKIADKWTKVKIECFDNTITVYWDYGEGMVKIGSLTDNSKYTIGVGSVGIWSDGLGVDIDNVLVRELDDYSGSTYDNKICGNWDKPVPDLVQQYADNGWYKY